MMSNKISFLLLSSILLISAISCENDLSQVKNISAVNSTPTESAKNIELIRSDSGKIQMLLTSPVLNKFLGGDPYMEFPKGIKILFYDSLMNVRTTLTANYAIKYDGKKMMEARNDVVIINHDKNERINTEHIVWDQQRKIIYSDVFVKRTSADEVLYGDGFDADENFNSYTLRNPRGIFTIDKENN